jgi:hypothetical protein
MFARHENMFARHENMFARHENMFARHENMFARHENMFASEVKTIKGKTVFTTNGYYRYSTKLIQVVSEPLD